MVRAHHVFLTIGDAQGPQKSGLVQNRVYKGRRAEIYMKCENRICNKRKKAKTFTKISWRRRRGNIVSSDKQSDIRSRWRKVGTRERTLSSESTFAFKNGMWLEGCHTVWRQHWLGIGRGIYTSPRGNETEGQMIQHRVRWWQRCGEPNWYWIQWRETESISLL